jgi:hypothetical protein
MQSNSACCLTGGPIAARPDRKGQRVAPRVAARNALTPSAHPMNTDHWTPSGQHFFVLAVVVQESKMFGQPGSS